jgi:hypothetical protein
LFFFVIIVVFVSLRDDCRGRRPAFSTTSRRSRRGTFRHSKLLNSVQTEDDPAARG